MPLMERTTNAKVMLSIVCASRTISSSRTRRLHCTLIDLVSGDRQPGAGVIDCQRPGGSRPSSAAAYGAALHTELVRSYLNAVHFIYDSPLLKTAELTFTLEPPFHVRS